MNKYGFGSVMRRLHKLLPSDLEHSSRVRVGAYLYTRPGQAISGFRKWEYFKRMCENMSLGKKTLPEVGLEDVTQVNVLYLLKDL